MRRTLPIMLVAWTCSVGDGQAQLLTSDPLLAETIRLYGQPVISANPYLFNSTSNEAGPWGSEEFLYSFANDVGPLGSPEFLNSVSNDVGTGLKVRFSEKMLEQVPGLRATVEAFGEPIISANPYLLNSISNESGPWGAKEFLYSFANDAGPLGSPSFLHSVSNDVGLGLEVELVQPILDLDAP
jgi:hypothetical protein